MALGVGGEEVEKIRHTKHVLSKDAWWKSILGAGRGKFRALHNNDLHPHRFW